MNNETPIINELNNLININIKNTLHFNFEYFKYQFYQYDLAIFSHYQKLKTQYEKKQIYLDTKNLDILMEHLIKIKSNFNDKENLNFYFFMSDYVLSFENNLIEILDKFITFNQNKLNVSNKYDVLDAFSNYKYENNVIHTSNLYTLITISINKTTLNTSLSLTNINYTTNNEIITFNHSAIINVDLKLIHCLMYLQDYLRHLKFETFKVENSTLHFYIEYRLGYNYSSNNNDLKIVNLMNENILKDTNFKLVIYNDYTYLKYDTKQLDFNFDTIQQIYQNMEFLNMLDSFASYFIGNKKHELDIDKIQSEILLKYFNKLLHHKINRTFNIPKIPYYFANLNDYLDYVILNKCDKKEDEFYVNIA